MRRPSLAALIGGPSSGAAVGARTALNTLAALAPARGGRAAAATAAGLVGILRREARIGHRFERGQRHRRGALLVLDDALERPGAPLGEVEPRVERLDAHLQVAVLDAQPRQLDDDVVQYLEVERVTLLQVIADPGDRPREVAVQRRLHVQDLDQRIRVEEQLEDRIEDLAEVRRMLPDAPRDEAYIVSASNP